MFLAAVASSYAKPISVPVVSHGPIVSHASYTPYAIAHAPTYTYAHAPVVAHAAPVAVAHAAAEDYDPHPQYSYAYDIKVRAYF